MKNRLIISAGVAFAIQVFMMYVAWEHNPQCEIHCIQQVNDGYILLGEQYVNLGHWLFIGLSWFVPTFVIVFVVLTLIAKITNKS